MKGRAQIERTDKIGMVYIAKELNRGSVFGEEALLFGGGGNDCIRTLTFCDICLLNKEKFDELLSSASSDVKSLISQLCGELSKRNSSKTFSRNRRELHD